VTDVPGLEAAGTVIALGRDVRDLALGDYVTALLPGGGYAEYCVAAASMSFKIPPGLTRQEAAGLPEALFTVWANVFEAGGLKFGETLLIQGGSSGIGTVAIQMGRLFGARVLATAGSDEKCQASIELGAEAINYQTDNFKARVLEITKGAGVDVILDLVGGPYLADHLSLLAPGGRLAIIAVQGGYKAEINLLPILSKHLVITGSTLRPRSLSEKSRLAAAIRQHVWPWVESGQLRPIIDSQFPLAHVHSAHQRMLSGKHFGKIILDVETTQ
jgi:putative PIG3 family NAD(P)H quinone oxidoreductase